MDLIWMGPKAYFRVRNAASGPELVDLWALNGPLLPQNPVEKVGASPPTFSNGFRGRRSRLDSQKSAISIPEALLRNLNYNGHQTAESQGPPALEKGIIRILGRPCLFSREQLSMVIGLRVSIKQHAEPPDHPRRTPEYLPKPRESTLGGPQIAGFQSGEGYSKLPRRWGTTRGSSRCHYDFVRNLPLWCCLIYPLTSESVISTRRSGHKHRNLYLLPQLVSTHNPMHDAYNPTLLKPYSNPY
jgi:hypothetical protein